MKKNNKGMTLVEMIIGILLLGIISLMFARSFSSMANIVNRATMYKNASSIATTAIELQDDSYANSISKDSNINIVFSKNADQDSEDTSKKTVKVFYKDKNAPEGSALESFSIKGDLLSAVDDGSTNLNYKEFVPGNYFIVK